LKRIVICFVVFTMILINFVFASSFDDYYKEWKKENNTVNDVPYQSNLTDEEKAKEAEENIDKMFDTITIDNLKDMIKSKEEQIEDLKFEKSKKEKNYNLSIIIINLFYILIILLEFVFFKVKEKKMDRKEK